MRNNRIEILDGFRGVAISLVILFHFFSRWTNPFNYINLYPYGNNFDIFPNGLIGVKFFFMISGFVIFMTLEKTESLSLSLLNRLIRLLPTMFLVSLATLVLFNILGNNFLFYDRNVNFKNFLVSIFFVSPEVLKYLHFDSNYLNGSYWSLWPEIQFYAYVAIIYFFFLKRKFEIIIFISSTIILLNYIINRENIPFNIGYCFKNSLSIYRGLISGPLNLVIYLPHFISGVIWYHFYSKQYKSKRIILNAIIFILVIFQIYSAVTWQYQLLIACFNILFFFLCFKPNYLLIFSNRFIQMIGIGSYALYLFHEQVGVALINKMSEKWPVSLQLGLVILMILLMIFVSYIYTLFVEKKIISRLKSLLILDKS